jgi:hypothetical protein
LRSLIHADDAAAARMRDVAAEHRKLGAALDQVNRATGEGGGERGAFLRAHP